MGSLLSKGSKVYVAGHTGLVGSAITRQLRKMGSAELLLRTHAELDLTSRPEVQGFFRLQRPTHVILAAAKVGGIAANSSFPADFLHQNLLIQSNVIEAAHQSSVEKLLFLGSSCIYPKHCPQPIREEYLLTGSLEPTNESYAIAKIAGLKLCAAYNTQYGTDFLAVMPTNLYGPGDNYHVQHSHVIPALIAKFHAAKTSGTKSVLLWGTGKPQREFLYVDDLADACIFVMDRYSATDIGQFVNVGSGSDLTIESLASLIAAVVGFDGNIEWDPSMPDGTPRKLLDVSRLSSLGWRYKTELQQGLRLAYADYTSRAHTSLVSYV